MPCQITVYVYGWKGVQKVEYTILHKYLMNSYIYFLLFWRMLVLIIYGTVQSLCNFCLPPTRKLLTLKLKSNLPGITGKIVQNTGDASVSPICEAGGLITRWRTVIPNRELNPLGHSKTRSPWQNNNNYTSKTIWSNHSHFAQTRWYLYCNWSRGRVMCGLNLVAYQGAGELGG